MAETKTKNVAKDKERLKAWVKKILPNDYDKFDVDAEFDSGISYEENKSAMRDKLKTVIKDLKAQAEQAQAQQEQIENERKQQAEREVEEYNSNLTYNDKKEIDQFYSPIIMGINKMCQGYSNLLFIKGRGGIGKSYQIRKALVKNNADFVEVCGEVSEAYLYRLIYENNGKILWFKDVVKLLAGLSSINLLKAATETEEKKILTKSNYSKQQDDLPDKFACKCKFIFDYNNIFGLQLKEDFEALATRGDYKVLPFSDDDVKHIMKLVAQDDKEKDTTQYIIDNFESNGIVKLNLRTQWKAFKTREYCEKNNIDWKEGLKNELTNVTKTRALLYTLIGTKAVKTTELKKKLLKNELVSSLRTAHRRINEWLYTEELYKWSSEERDFYICINQKK